MPLLLDTHIAIWAVADPKRLSRQAVRMLDGAADGIFVSAVSIWEIAIKQSQVDPRRRLPFSADKAIEMFRAVGFLSLDIRPEHAAAVEHLPMLHGDPFDRLLLAQARTEPMHLLSHDAALIAYGACVIAV